MNKMKRYRFILLCLIMASSVLASVTLSAQTVDYAKRYNNLIARVGPSGIGVETLLNMWALADSLDRNMLQARFDFYFSKSQTETVVSKPQKKYLGMDPLLSLADSLGNKVYYYREMSYDDELFSKALNTAEKMVALYPDELDYYFLKANALIAYEKENPDMAYAYLSDLIDIDQSRKRPWNFNGEKMQSDFFADAMQEYCRTFYTVGSPSAMKAFLDLSVRLNKLYPANTYFLSNIATYYLVAEDKPKLALKYYNKVLKKAKNDEVALRNSYVAAKKCGDTKLEAKYRQMLIDNGYVK